MVNKLKIELLESEIDIMIHALKLKPTKYQMGQKVSVQFAIDDFGVVVCGIERSDYKSIADVVENKFDGWRIVYITTEDSMIEKKEDLIWELMRSGYMKWIRMKYPRDFNNLITMSDFGNKIIQHRLKIWADRPKYRYMVEENKGALGFPSSFILSSDQSFFDYMP